MSRAVHTEIFTSRLIVGGIILSFTVLALLYSCSEPGPDREGDGTASSGESAHREFVGDQTCRSCHAEQGEAWEGSQHDYAMKKATGATVRGDFGDVSFTHQNETYRFFQKDSLFMVEAPGPDGEPARYRVTHTFGWTPLQQYLVDFGKGKLQVLNIAWDTRRNRWFALNPGEDIRHGDWLHWTGGAMNWNTMCADCHSTDLRQNYIAEADSFHTTWSSINVSCEACHGPGRDHVEFMRGEEAAEATVERIRRDLRLAGGSSQEAQIGQCAQCHALREELTGTYDHTGNFLDHFNPTFPHPPSYFADGQIREEVYVYASFLQSRMYANGVKCNDCHDPHSLQLKANVTDNSLCLQCHEPRYDSPEHHYHQPNTTSSQCISCHMPGRYYMEIDFRRDHSFRVPRPDLSARYGTPNACNSCHEDRSERWAAEAVEQWYGTGRQDHYAGVLARADTLGRETLPELESLISDTAQPAIIRATAFWYLGQFATGQNLGLFREGLADEHPLVRNGAARALAGLPPGQKEGLLQEALDDSVRAVRLAAAGGLAEFTAADIAFNLKQAFHEALEEYERYLEANRYFPQGEMNRGQYFEKRGQIDKAIASYRKALEKDSQFNPARINLAYLYNRRGRNGEAVSLLEQVIEQEPAYGPARYSLGLLLAEQNRMEAAVSQLEEAARLMPGHARVRYNLAISYQNLNRPDDAARAYGQAIALSPENPDLRYGICTLYLQQGRYEKALPHARKLVELQPQNPRFRRLLSMVEEQVQ